MNMVRWLRQELFSSWLNGLLTLLCLVFLIKTIPPLVSWMVLDATWSGATQAKECTGAGACWPFISARWTQFMYGFYPIDEIYRVNWAGVLLIAGVGQWFIPKFSLWIKTILTLMVASVIFWLLFGGWGLPVVPTAKWGGLFLTIALAFSSIVCSFPIALLLALGRTSQLPIIKSVCIVFIELVRGVPLITVLFMASVMLPMFLPSEVDLNKLFRAFVGITLFQAAYLAEVIRGGLLAIPKGQTEAAQALGLNYWRTMGLIVLPQALKVMIPGIVNTFIALFKDTTLVLMIGLLDFLSIVQTATKDAKWLGMATEGYVFCAIVYFFFCYCMSQYSRYLERKYHTGHQDELR